MTPERLDYFHKRAMAAPFGTIPRHEMLDILDHIRDLEAQLAAAREDRKRLRKALKGLLATATPPSPEVGE